MTIKKRLFISNILMLIIPALVSVLMILISGLLFMNIFYKQFMDETIHNNKLSEMHRILVEQSKEVLSGDREIENSGLYETMQFPFSYLTGEKELNLVNMCRENNVGFIAMKGLAGGLINNSRAAFAFISQFDNVLPIWGIQTMDELGQWLSYMETPPVLNEELQSVIDADRKELDGEFCRGCGYCMPCPQGIKINNCARMSLMVRRSPSDSWLSEEWQQAMMDIEKCVGCGACTKK